MNVTAARARPKRSAIGIEEERAWVSFYRRAGKDPVIAAEVLAQLDTDPEMKREHLALYLCCRQSLRHAQHRQWRNRQLAQLVRLILFGPWHALQRLWQRSEDIAIACLPEDSTHTPAPSAPAIATRRPRTSMPANARNGHAAPKPAN